MATTAAGPRVLPDAVEFTVFDPDARYRSVLLAQDVQRPRIGPRFERDGNTWRLRLERPDADRMEYLLQVDGELMADPANPRRAAGPFGNKSVVEWPEYEPPAWLDTIADEGPVEEIEVRCRRLVARVRVLLYETPDPPAPDAPLLVAHDGPEYAHYSALTRFLDAMSWEERIPPMRAALIQPVDRDETYSASALYSAALVRELLPEISRLVRHGPRIGMGASLGALAMLHAHRRHPRAFDALLLQSGSFFRQRWDKHESGFPRYRRITRFVGTVLRGEDAESIPRVPIAVTCGTAEENVHNNRAMAAALNGQGYTVWLGLVRDSHTWTCWRDALDPHLATLIAAIT
jgi:enterochelin esterase family protein